MAKIPNADNYRNRQQPRRAEHSRHQPNRHPHHHQGYQQQQLRLPPLAQRVLIGLSAVVMIHLLWGGLGDLLILMFALVAAILFVRHVLRQ